MATNYWDLSERERSALTADDVEKFAAFELMQKGVLRSKPLELVPVPEMPEPEVTVYVIEAGYHTAEIAFPDAETASRAAAMASGAIGTVWIGSDHESSFEPRKDVAGVKPKKVFSQRQLTECRAVIEKSKAAKAENERRTAEHGKRVKAESEALKGMWEDWHHCVALARQMAEVISVFEEYKTTAGGDAVVASRFLTKVFTQTQIKAAAEWCGVEIPEPVYAPTAEAPKTVDAEITF